MKKFIMFIILLTSLIVLFFFFQKKETNDSSNQTSESIEVRSDLTKYLFDQDLSVFSQSASTDLTKITIYVKDVFKQDEVLRYSVKNNTNYELLDTTRVQFKDGDSYKTIPFPNCPCGLTCNITPPTISSLQTIDYEHNGNFTFCVDDKDAKFSFPKGNYRVIFILEDPKLKSEVYYKEFRVE